MWIASSKIFNISINCGGILRKLSWYNGQNNWLPISDVSKLLQKVSLFVFDKIIFTTSLRTMLTAIFLKSVFQPQRFIYVLIEVIVDLPVV